MSIRQIMLEPVKISRRIRDREMLENRLREILKETGLDESIFVEKARESFPADRDRESLWLPSLFRTRILLL